MQPSMPNTPLASQSRALSQPREGRCLRAAEPSTPQTPQRFNPSTIRDEGQEACINRLVACQPASNTMGATNAADVSEEALGARRSSLTREPNLTLRQNCRSCQFWQNVKTDQHWFNHLVPNPESESDSETESTTYA